uniref:Smad anchor for receptor activation-like C-terminal domain-containing protein n=1 Tax=Schistosoma haematobium TaxID=6185 RepID=A0A095CEU5_SCHHA
MSKSTTPSEEFGYPNLPVRQKSDQESISQCIKTLKSRRPNTLDFSPLALGNRDRNHKTYAKRPTVLSVHDSLQKAVCSASAYSSSAISDCPIKRPNFLPIPSQGSKYPGFPKPSDGLMPGNSKNTISTVKAPLNTGNIHAIHPDSMGLFIKKKLVLQFNPPVGLLISLLENTNKTSGDLYNKNVHELTIDSEKGSLDSVSMIPVTQSECLSKSDNVSPGITIALTRNLHIRVHSTELNCCLKQSAWCFSSSGFYQFGQEEIVILLRRRFDEKLPPMEIFYQYWLIYQALVNYAEKQVKSDVNFGRKKTSLNLVTGLSFVAFSGHAPFCSAIIVEDGLYISMTSLKFHQLVNSLKNGYDLSIPIRSSSNIQPSTIVEHINGDFGDDISNRDLFNGNVASSVHVKWFKVFDSFLSRASFSTTVTPCCTNSAGIWDLEPITTFLVPVHYQLWHWIHLNESIIPSSESQLSSLSTTKSSDPPSLRLAWIRFHVLNVDQLEFISTSSSKTITFGHFANEVAECVIKALRPYLGHLLSNNRTQITLRILLQPPDQVGYRMGASCQEVYTLHNQLDSSNDLENASCENCEEMYADALDDILLPVLSSWTSCLKIVDVNIKEIERRSPSTSNSCYHLNEIIQMEFDFCILN